MEISPEYSLEGLILKLKLWLWPPDSKNWLIWKDSDAGKDWRGEEKGMTEDEIVGWHHWLSGSEFEQAPGVCDRQGSSACCSSWVYRESQMTVNELNWLQDFTSYWFSDYWLAYLVWQTTLSSTSLCGTKMCWSFSTVCKFLWSSSYYPMGCICSKRKRTFKTLWKSVNSKAKILVVLLFPTHFLKGKLWILLYSYLAT